MTSSSLSSSCIFADVLIFIFRHVARYHVIIIPSHLRLFSLVVVVDHVKITGAQDWRRWFWRNLRRSRLGHSRISGSQTGISQTTQTSFENGSSRSQTTPRLVFVVSTIRHRPFIQSYTHEHCSTLPNEIIRWFVIVIHSVIAVFLGESRRQSSHKMSPWCPFFSSFH